MSIKPLFIVWHHFTRRAETLTTELGGRVCYEYEGRLEGKLLTPLRYLAQAWKTWRLLERERPAVVIVQSPPIFAPLVVAAWCVMRGKMQRRGYRTSYIVDCHPGTFYDPNWRWALPLVRLVTRGAMISLLCNEEAQDLMRRWQVKSIFLPDGLPSLDPDTGAVGSEGAARIAVICTFAYDEPVATVFAAARLLSHVTFYVTGNPQRAVAGLLAQKPDNVILTGFLRASAYAGLLANVHGIAVLTNMPISLSCGAFESLALGKPTLISDWPAARRCFKRGFVYAANTPEAIAAGVRMLLEEQESLGAEISAMRAEYAATRRPKLEELIALLK
jgi:glycosyltransferase involved in cell wall biosynthesis